MKQRLERKTPAELAAMRAAGQIVAQTLAAVRAAVAPGVSTAALDELAYATIVAAGAKPSFLGYHGYPATLCTSVNDRVVHGIPRREDIVREGDVVSIDCGAILDGWHGDAAITVLVGNVRPELARMAQVCADAMWAGIAQMRPGKRLSDISHAIEQSVRAAGRYGIVRDYGGHGIGTEMHQDPHLPNYGKPGQGPRLEPGVVLAIEPMITAGSARTRELADGWTVVTKDGSWAVHTEHTVAVTETGPTVLTAPVGDAS